MVRQVAGTGIWVVKMAGSWANTAPKEKIRANKRNIFSWLYFKEIRIKEWKSYSRMNFFSGHCIAMLSLRLQQFFYDQNSGVFRNGGRLR